MYPYEFIVICNRRRYRGKDDTVNAYVILTIVLTTKAGYSCSCVVYLVCWPQIGKP